VNPKTVEMQFGGLPWLRKGDHLNCWHIPRVPDDWLV